MSNQYSNCQHYWKIHKKFSKKLWDSLSLSSREIIANDVEGESEMFKYFGAAVTAETNRVFLDEEFYFNNIATFYAIPKK
jgi:hypothetical protein